MFQLETWLVNLEIYVLFNFWINLIFPSLKSGPILTFLLTAIAAVLSFIMGQRYMQTGKIMPAGIVAGIR